MKNFTLRVDEVKNIAYIKQSGRLSKETILNAFDLTVFDKRYKKGMGRLWDFRDADLSDIDAMTVIEMAQYSIKFPPGVNDVKVAFVTSRDLEYGLSRMFQMSSNASTPIRVFRSMASAEKWLNKSDSILET